MAGYIIQWVKRLASIEKVPGSPDLATAFIHFPLHLDLDFSIIVFMFSKQDLSLGYTQSGLIPDLQTL